MKKTLVCAVFAVSVSVGVSQHAWAQIYAGEGGASETSALGSLLSGALVVGLPIISISVSFLVMDTWSNFGPLQLSCAFTSPVSRFSVLRMRSALSFFRIS